MPVQHKRVEVLRKRQVLATPEPTLQNKHDRWFRSQPEHRNVEIDFNFWETIPPGEQKTGGTEDPN